MGRNLLFAIGIEHYTDSRIENLPNAPDDVRKVANALKSAYGFDEQILLIYSDATREGIITVLDSFSDTNSPNFLRPEDTLLLYYAGHGYIRNRIGYWVPTDAQDGKPASLLSHSNIVQDYLRVIHAKHIFLMVDSCFSGAMLRRGDPPPNHRAQDDFPSRKCLVSSTISETASDGYAGGNSPFADAVTQFLLHHPAPFFSASALRDHVIEAVQKATSDRQLPLLGSLNDGTTHIGEYYFRKTQPFPPVAAIPPPPIAHAPAQPAEDKVYARLCEQGDEYFNAADYEKALACYRKAVRLHTNERLQTKIALCEEEIAEAAEKARQVEQQRAQAEAAKRAETARHAEQQKAQAERDRFQALFPMVFIKGGAFDMGSNDYDNEKPIHRVTVSDFYMGEMPVTVAQFREFVKATNHKTDAEKDGGSFIWENASWVKKEGITWRNSTDGGTAQDNHPVIHVSWNDADACCKWLSEKTGTMYRLPTEAEWEYAAGGGAKKRTRFGNGKDIADPAEMNFDGSAADKTAYSVAGIYREKTTVVKSFSANALGLYDMSGNVWEWCEDWYHNSYAGAPTDGSAWLSPAGSGRVFRGGGWLSYPRLCRVALRGGDSPMCRFDYLGFRVVRLL